MKKLKNSVIAAFMLCIMLFTSFSTNVYADTTLSAGECTIQSVEVRIAEHQQWTVVVRWGGKDYTVSFERDRGDSWEAIMNNPNNRASFDAVINEVASEKGNTSIPKKVLQDKILGRVEGAFTTKRNEINEEIAAQQRLGGGELYYTVVDISGEEFRSTNNGANYNALWNIVINKLAGSSVMYKGNAADNATAANLIQSAAASAPGIDTLNQLAASLGGVPTIYDETGTGQSFKVPIFMLVPNWSGSSESAISFQNFMNECYGGGWPVTSDPGGARSQAEAWLQSKGVTSLNSGELFNTGTTSGQYFSGKYVIGFEVDPAAVGGTFYATGEPKKKAVVGPWSANDTAIFKVYMTPDKAMLDGESGLYNITVTATPSGGDVTLGTPSFAASNFTVSGIPTTEGNKFSFNVTKEELKKFGGTGTGTGGKAHIIVQFPVSGNGANGGEQEGWASFTVTSESVVQGSKAWEAVLNDKDSDWNGTQTKASWVPSETPPPPPSELIHMDWELHTAARPTAAGTIVGNEYGSEDWEATTAIPSTENVSAVLGAETAMIDLNGWVTATKNGVAGAHGGEMNQVWTPAPQAAVTRTIKVTSRVSNIWGRWNSVDLLQPIQQTANGGQSFSCPHNNISHTGPSGSNQHSGNVSWTCGSHTNEQHIHSWSCSGTGGEHEEQSTDAQGNVTATWKVPDTWNCGGCGYSHDCTWYAHVIDGAGSANLNIPKGNSVSTLSGFSISWEANIPSGYKWSGSTMPISGGTWNIPNMSFAGATQGPQHTGRLTGTITFTPVANQYFMVSGGFSSNTLNGYENCRFSPSLGSGQPFSQGYTQGTGNALTSYENMVHQGSHEYSLTYIETIGNYAYRRIANAVVYSLMGSEIDNIHQIDFQGGPNDGTEGAPITDAADGQSVSAPEMFGCLWRGLNSTAGQYESGSGRIVFEAWKNTSGNFGVSTSVTPDYFLGDAEITFNITSDHKFGEACVATPNNGVSWVKTISETNVTNRGQSMNRICSSAVTSSVNEYMNNATKGDCTDPAWNGTTDYNKGSGNGDSQYVTQITSMQRAVANEWQTRNSADGTLQYTANVLSDTFCYGNMQNTTVVRGDIYGVDDDGGVKLFNYQMGIGAGNAMDGAQTVYRNHGNGYSAMSGAQLANLLKGDAMSIASISDGAHMPYFGYSDEGMNEFDGGDQAFASSLPGALRSGNLTAYGGGGPGVSLTKGEGVASSAFGGEIPASSSYGSGSGSTTIVGNSGECGGSGYFQGYWNDHTYEGQHGTTLSAKVNDSLAVGSYSATNCGTHNLSSYGASMIISNLQLNPYTPNGSWDTCNANFKYIETLTAVSSGGASDGASSLEALTASVRLDSHRQASESGLQVQLPTIHIYNPISTEFSQVIGNEYGNWSGNEGLTPDETKYDYRVDSEGVDPRTLEPYTTPTRRTQVWITPIGDMNLVDGTAMSTDSEGASSVTGEVYRNSGLKGYSKNMNVERWISNWGIKYPHVTRFNNSIGEDVNSYYSIADINRVYGGFRYGPDALQNFKEEPRDHEFKYGDCFHSKTTTFLNEVEDGLIAVVAEASNNYVMSGSDTAQYGFTAPSEHRNNRTTNTCYTEIEIDVVGSIGNLAIHDTTDFRYSNFFKNPTDEYLISGTVKKVDSEHPLKIVSSAKDILEIAVERDATSRDNKRTHATLGVDDYGVVKSDGTTEYGYGMAGPYEVLPLVPAYNTIKEFKSEAVRLGYKVLASVDTIGNYQAIIADGTVYPVSTSQENDPTLDTRDQYLEIKSHYYLYDFDDGKFYAIDLWSGGTGQKSRIYNGKTDEVEFSRNTEALYVNMDEEANRRNISSGEMNVSTTNSIENISPTAINSGEDYIGYTGHLKLDNRNLTYNGSDFAMGDNYGELTDRATQVGNRGQRYHFTQGLTSSTSASYHVDSNDQAVIEAATQRLKEEHPHAVIVEFNDFIAHGAVWTIRLHGSQVNSPTIKFFSDVAEERPDWITASSYTETTYQDAEVYDRGGTDVLYTIDKELTPLVTYEAYKTAADDRAVSGTH